MDLATPPSTNFLGAAVFWLYNIAALSFTATVISTLLKIPQVNDETQARRRRATYVFSALAAVSFTILSFNMLGVLVQSYLEWSGHHQASLEADGEGILTRIWTWSITSTLFHDFGEAIVADQARYVWTLSALFATLGVCTYMGVEGQRRQIPRLWAFFALSQILPISFAQNLFYIALVRQHPQAVHVDVHPAAIATLLLVLCNVLVVAPQTAGTSSLMPLIVVARLLLLAPPTIVQKGSGTAKAALNRTLQLPIAVIALLLVGRQVYTAYGTHSIRDIGSALVSHPAVSALGFDFILSMVSFSVWTLIPQLMQDLSPRHMKRS